MAIVLSDDDPRDDEEPGEEESRERQRRHWDGGPPYGFARLQQQLWKSQWPYYERLFTAQDLGARLKVAHDILNYTPAVKDFSESLALLQIPQWRMGIEAFQGYALQSWSAISSVAAWAQASDSLRRLISNYFDVPRIGAWVDSLRLDYYPPNWPAELRIKDVRNLAEEEGIPLCWVPRAEVIDALRLAEPASRRDVLLKHRVEVLEDCTAALVEVTAPELAPFSRSARKVVAAMRDGHDEPAQALAMNVVDATLRGTIFEDVPKFRFYRPMLTKIEETRNCLLKDFRRSATLWPLLRLFDHFSPGTDEVPSRANRHATAHTVDDVQYTPANALIATMLAVSVLREVQESLILDEAAQSAGELEAGPAAAGTAEA